MTAKFNYSEALLDAHFSSIEDPSARLMYLFLCVGVNGVNDGYNSIDFKNAVCRTAFEKVGCNVLTFVPNPLLGLFSMNRASGILVDLGIEDEPGSI